MTKYNLRTHDGFLKAIIPSSIASQMLSISAGEWKTAPDGVQYHRFQFPDNRAAMATQTSWTDKVSIVFATGDYIEAA